MLLLTTTRDALLAPLQSVAGIVEKRHTLPILSNVLIEKHGDQLTMLATDIEIQIRTTTGGHIGGKDASITVGAMSGVENIAVTCPPPTKPGPVIMVGTRTALSWHERLYSALRVLKWQG